MDMMRELPRMGGVAIQGEDEIASIGMCIGAAMAGARAMTATSGPGISLYSENLGLALMGEVPLVVVDVQRLGPATGGATTVSQGDVQFVRWGTAGGFPVIVLAPSDLAECRRLTARAFELAERFRCPVFLLTDKELVMTANTVEVTADAAPPRPAAPPPADWDGARPYRYQPPDGVSPLVPFGAAGTVRFTGSTHDERAFLTKDPSTVGALNRHLVAKVEEHRDEIEEATLTLDPRAATLFVAYGVTAGAMREAAARLADADRPASTLTLQSLWPVPEAALAAALEGHRRVVVAELNHGLYRREVERLAGGREVVGLTRVDGELITPRQFEETWA